MWTNEKPNKKRTSPDPASSSFALNAKLIGPVVIPTSIFFCLSKESMKDSATKSAPKRKRGAPLSKPVAALPNEDDLLVTKYFVHQNNSNSSTKTNKVTKTVTSTTGTTSLPIVNEQHSITGNTASNTSSSSFTTVPTVPMDSINSTSVTTTATTTTLGKPIFVSNDYSNIRKRKYKDTFSNSKISNKVPEPITNSLILVSKEYMSGQPSPASTAGSATKYSRSSSPSPPQLIGKYSATDPTIDNTMDNIILPSSSTIHQSVLISFIDPIQTCNNVTNLTPLLFGSSTPLVIPSSTSTVLNTYPSSDNSTTIISSSIPCLPPFPFLNLTDEDIRITSSNSNDIPLHRPRGDSKNSIRSNTNDSDEDMTLLSFIMNQNNGNNYNDDDTKVNNHSSTILLPFPSPSTVSSTVFMPYLSKSDSLDLDIGRTFSGPPGNDNDANNGSNYGKNSMVTSSNTAFRSLLSSM